MEKKVILIALIFYNIFFTTPAQTLKVNLVMCMVSSRKWVRRTNFAQNLYVPGI